MSLKLQSTFFYYTDELESTYEILYQKNCGGIFTVLIRQLYEITRAAEIFQSDPKNIVPYFIHQYKENIRTYEKCIKDQKEINQSYSKNKISDYQELLSQWKSDIETLKTEYPDYPQWSKLIGDWAVNNAVGEEQLIFISRETFNVLSEAAHCKANFLFNRYHKHKLPQDGCLHERLNAEQLWEEDKKDNELFWFWLNRTRDTCVRLINE